MHCADIVKKAYFVLRNSFNTFKRHDTEFMLRCIQPMFALSPVLKLNIDRVDSVQRYFTRRVLYKYLTRIEYLGVCTLDLVLYFKLVSDETEIRANDLFRNANSQRGHNSQLATLYWRTEKRKLFWPNRLAQGTKLSDPPPRFLDSGFFLETGI